LLGPWCPARSEINKCSARITQARLAQSRRIFALRLRAEPNNDDPIRNLRALLKAALRRHRFRCLEAVEEKTS
jgi:hypothetical protein